MAQRYSRGLRQVLGKKRDYMLDTNLESPAVMCLGSHLSDGGLTYNESPSRCESLHEEGKVQLGQKKLRLAHS